MRKKPNKSKKHFDSEKQDLSTQELLFELKNPDGVVFRVRKGTKQNTNTDVVVTILDGRVGDAKEKPIRHIYWLIDVLMKKTGDPNLTKEFLSIFTEAWKTVETFKSNSKADIELWINQHVLSADLKKFDSLNNYGFLPIDTLFNILMTLTGNEKSAGDFAYRYKLVLNRVVNDDSDLYDLIALADNNKKDLKEEKILEERKSEKGF